MHRVISIRKQGWNWISNQEDLNCVDVDEIVNVRKQKQPVDKQSQYFLKSAHILDADEVPSLIKQEFGGQSLNSSSTHHMSSDVCRSLAENEQSRHQYIYPIRERNIRKPNKGRNRVLRPENQGTGVGYARGRY